MDTIPINQLDVDYGIRKSGNTKFTYPGMFGARRVAVKLFRKFEAESRKPINSDSASRREFNDYDLTFNSSIQPYVPEPYKLITNEEETKLIGLIVEWRAGDILSSQYGRVKVPQQALFGFKERLLRLPSDRQLDFDSLAEANVGWDGGRLWLAEPQILSYESPDIWIGIASRQVERLLQDYT